jgi:hypothetical protein
MAPKSNAIAPSLNRVEGFGPFISRWGTPPASFPDPRGARARSAVGNINDAASPDCNAAQIFVPGDALFVDSLEPGIRPAVLVIVGQLCWITYTSCEGHPAVGEVPLRRRNIGIVPRDEAEASCIVRVLTAAVARAYDVSPPVGVKLEIVTRALDTEDGPRPCIDLVFRPSEMTWDAYRVQCNTLQQLLVAALQEASVDETL